jgi:PAS domain S-box-containing protein
VLMARSLTRPLAQLTESAHTLSVGDLSVPVPIPDDPDEVATLAAALEKSRASIQQTMEELSRAKVWAETLIQSIVEGVITFDTAGRIAFFSDGAERILGCPRDEVLGQPLAAVFRLPGEGEAGSADFLDRIPPRGKRQKVDVIAPDGRPLTLALTGERLAPPESDDVQVVLVFQDITEEEATRNLRSHILANITHEFRTPLAALNASLELLSDHPQVAQADVDELLASMQLGILNLRTLINNLLESSSIEAGRFDLHLRATDLNVVLAEAVQMVRPLLAARGQTLTLAEPAHLPQVQADAARLVQVFINLLSNASKYGPPGSAVDLSFEVLDNAVKVTTADRGPGISEKERQMLFRRFMRLDRPDDPSQYGIGLGLAVAKAIVDGHGGEIGVAERPGGGAEFWFTVNSVQEASRVP